MRKYGISGEDWRDMHRRQKGKCAICGTVGAYSDRGLHVDHDHVTGKFRGLLCAHCNHGLGKFKDSKKLLRLAIEYLSD